MRAVEQRSGTLPFGGPLAPQGEQRLDERTINSVPVVAPNPHQRRRPQMSIGWIVYVWDPDLSLIAGRPHRSRLTDGMKRCLERSLRMIASNGLCQDTQRSTGSRTAPKLRVSVLVDHVEWAHR